MSSVRGNTLCLYVWAGNIAQFWRNDQESISGYSVFIKWHQQPHSFRLLQKQMVADEGNTSEGRGRANYPPAVHLEDVMPGGQAWCSWVILPNIHSRFCLLCAENSGRVMSLFIRVTDLQEHREGLAYFSHALPFIDQKEESWI